MESDAFAEWAEGCRDGLDAPAVSAGAAAARLIRLAGSLPGSLSASQQEIARTLLHAVWLRFLSVVVPTAPGSSSSPSVSAAPDPRVERALAEITRRFGDPTLRLRAVARQLAVSDCRLTHLLKEATGWTFGAHLHARRVSEARRLLADSTLSVKEIAARVGYSTTTQLDRHFGKTVKVMPSEYRRMVRAARRAGDEGALRTG